MGNQVSVQDLCHGPRKFSPFSNLRGPDTTPASTICSSLAAPEAISFLHMRSSASPPTSASTLSSRSFNGKAGAETTALAEAAANRAQDEWSGEFLGAASGLDLVSIGGRCGLLNWENLMPESNHDQLLQNLRWIPRDVDDYSPSGLKQLLQNGGSNSLDFIGCEAGELGIVDCGVSFDHVAAVPDVISTMEIPIFCNSNVGSDDVSLPAPYLVYNQYQYHQVENSGEKPQIVSPENKPQVVNPQVVMVQPQEVQNANFFFPLSSHLQENRAIPPQPKRQNPGSADAVPQTVPNLPFSDLEQDFILRKRHQPQQQNVGFPPQRRHFADQKQVMVAKKEEIGSQQQQQALMDQLYKAAEMVGTGNFIDAHGILARLNQQLSPTGKPVHRAAFYFKEVLRLLLANNDSQVAGLLPKTPPAPFDIIFKMGAYKVFSEISPLIQFVNFTCNQALLEALDDAERIHIIDFDIGFGAQWASFMHELPRTRSNPSLRITAFASPWSHHPIELGLMRENLTQFAIDVGVSFEFDVIDFDSLEQSCCSLPFFRPNENEAVAVNFPVWSSSNLPCSLPSLLRFVKQLSPKIVLSLDRGCDRSDLTFPQHVLHALQSCVHFLEALDSINVNADIVNKIERFLLQPRIESIVLGRLRSPDKLPNWKAIFSSAGFSPITFSNFAESQAECLLKRSPARGFHLEKRQSLLILCWQNRELISASAWR